MPSAAGDGPAHRVDVRPPASAARAMTVDVDVGDREAARPRAARPRARSRSRLEASFQRGSVSGKCRPMSPGAAAPRMASVTAWQTHVGVGMPQRPAIEREWSRRRASAAGPRPADADRSRCRPASGRGRGRAAVRGAAIASASAQILGRRDLDVRRLALDQPHRDSRPVRPAPLRRSPRRRFAQGRARRRAPRARNACGVCARKIGSRGRDRSSTTVSGPPEPSSRVERPASFTVSRAGDRRKRGARLRRRRDRAAIETGVTNGRAAS